MRVRPLKDSDVDDVRAMYDESEINDSFHLEYDHIRVIEDDSGVVVGFAGARMVPEVVILLRRGHPAAKMHWLRRLQQELLTYLNDTGHRRAIALIAPKIERSFLRRLISLGWKEGCQSAIFEVADEGIGDQGTRPR